MSPIFDTTSGHPIELGEGRGDLRYSSVPFADWDGSPFFGGRPVSYAKLFATQPWVAIAVMRLLTWAVRVPLKVYRRLDVEGARQRLRPSDHPLAAAIASPWDRGSMAELVMALLGPLCVHGNGLTDVVDGAGGQFRFEALDWRMVMPIRFDDMDPNGEILGWKIFEPSTTERTRSADTVMHLRWWSPLGRLGISPLRQLQPAIEGDAAAIQWTLNTLGRAVRPTGVVEMTDEALGLDPADRRVLYDMSVEDLQKYAGSFNAGKLPVLPPGLKWADAKQTTAVEAELMAQRVMNRNEVASIYMIPPPMIGQLERSTYNNITTLRELAYTDGLAPPLVLIEQMINAHVVHWLLREDDVFVEFDLGMILRGDRLKEIQVLRQGVASAIYTPNEARQVLNMPPSDAPEADQLFIPGNNWTPLGSAQGDATVGSGMGDGEA
jgi:HK97 family phage portal protein